jgi:hypothetical protein
VGFELSVRKRMSHNWMMNGGFSYNNAPVHYDSPAAYEDPTNIDNLNGGQYAPESTSSGLGNVSIRGRQNAGNANQISSILAPRVIRFGFRATW